MGVFDIDILKHSRKGLSAMAFGVKRFCTRLGEYPAFKQGRQRKGLSAWTILVLGFLFFIFVGAVRFLENWNIPVEDNPYYQYFMLSMGFIIIGALVFQAVYD